MEKNRLCLNCGAVYSYKHAKCPYCFRIDYIDSNEKIRSGFKPCSNRAWHHLGTTCKVCGQKG